MRFGIWAFLSRVSGIPTGVFVFELKAAKEAEMQGFNYQAEKMKFEKAWEDREKAYRKAGMTEEQIQAMKEYDWETFNSDRRFYRRNVDAGSFSEDIDDLRDSNPAAPAPLAGEVEYSISSEDVYRMEELFGWVESLDSRELVVAIRRLSARQRKILDVCMREDCGQTEIAELLQMKQPNVNRDMKKIRELLEEARKKKKKSEEDDW